MWVQHGVWATHWLISSSIKESESFDRLYHNAHSADIECSQTAKPLRPREFRFLMAVPFVSFLVALAITLGVIWTKARPHGKMSENHWKLID